MLDHFLQRDIVNRLAYTETLRFSELKPDEIDNKLFTYHLKKTILAGFVEKTADGDYRLTSAGQKIGKSVHETETRLIDRAYSVLFLAVRRGDDWLLYTRGTHPLLGFTGFLQAKPQPGQAATATASQTLRKETGLEAKFHTTATGFFTITSNDVTESFINFTLLYAEDPRGDTRLETSDGTGNLSWQSNPDWSSPGMTPTLQVLRDSIDEPGISFLDQTIQRST